MLRPLQNLFDPADTPNLMVGLGVPDDAAVYRLDDERALIFTTDFFTPVVDDPYAYGAIAAANAMSDVYAMGGTPIMALAAAHGLFVLEDAAQSHGALSHEQRTGSLAHAVGLLGLASALTAGGLLLGRRRLATRLSEGEAV